MSKMIGNSIFVYDDAGKKILGVGGPDGTMSNFVTQYNTLADIPTNFSGTAQVGTQLYVGDGKSLQPIMNKLSNIRDKINLPNMFEKAAEPVAITWTRGAMYAGSQIASSTFYPIATGTSTTALATVNPYIYSALPLAYAYTDQGRNMYGAQSGVFNSFQDGGALNIVTFVTDADKIEFDLNTQGPPTKLQVLIDGKRISDYQPTFQQVISIGTTATTIVTNATSITLSATYPTTLAGKILCDVNGSVLGNIITHTAGTAAITVKAYTSNASTTRGTNNLTTIAALSNLYIVDTGSNYRTIVTANFGYSKVRKITLVAISQLAGIYLPPSYRLFKVKAPTYTTLYLGDSIGGYPGYYDTLGSIHADLIASLGYEGTAFYQIGGTGYLNRNANSYVTPRERLTALVGKGYYPDVMIMQTAINDSTNMETVLYQPIVDEVTAYYNYCSSTIPNTLIIANGSWGSDPAQVQQHPGHNMIGQLVLQRLQSGKNPFIFLDFLTGSIITSWGTIQDGSLVQASYIYHPDSVITTSNQAQYIAADPHPTSPDYGFGETEGKQGTVYASKWILNAVRNALNAYIKV